VIDRDIKRTKKEQLKEKEKLLRQFKTIAKQFQQTGPEDKREDKAMSAKDFEAQMESNLMSNTSE